ncbi:hypothetical protein NX801_06900 [Streptomyces sp. LP05-1]|uniref:Uncharacterized protein n=1 Tax=Streptomyces pyxinae TaxID=2970734 RepID=A0ABT2CFI3_9ACTN|nr:hypothetical protein [Streptomyces sp. LP05-1]MCS0635389.1 hypothetical protein [Streptomyces sp. LP05-1]
MDRDPVHDGPYRAGHVRSAPGASAPAIGAAALDRATPARRPLLTRAKLSAERAAGHLVGLRTQNIT